MADDNYSMLFINPVFPFATSPRTSVMINPPIIIHNQSIHEVTVSHNRGIDVISKQFLITQVIPDFLVSFEGQSVLGPTRGYEICGIILHLLTNKSDLDRVTTFINLTHYQSQAAVLITWFPVGYKVL